mgnify:CR=1 FL=1
MPMAVLVACCGVLHTVLHRLEQLFYRRRIAETKITQPPIFIIGHWRSGTTLLHELGHIRLGHIKTEHVCGAQEIRHEMKAWK